LPALTTLVAVLLPADVPVEPDADTARQWAREELLDPSYHQQQSLLRRLLDWLGDLFSDLPTLGLPPGVAPLIVVGVLLAVALVALWVAGPVRRSRRTPSREVLTAEDVRSAARLRADADAAAARGDWSLAVLERFRAVVRDLEERTVIESRPGRTAHEAAEAALQRMPTLRTGLRTAARLFDDVAYGGREATRADEAELRELDQRVRATRPQLPAGTADPVGAAR